MEIIIASKGRACDILVDSDCPSGLRRIASTLASDIGSVCGTVPLVHDELGSCTAASIVLAGICGESPYLDDLSSRGLIDLSLLGGRRESYLMTIVESPFPTVPGTQRALVIAGSDKRGCIYGMFALSEKIGVSPLVWIGDVEPRKETHVVVELDAAELSREPSVRYRGFFINDEWPAFGRWATEQFGGVNAKAYERVFELLLRLKGNYLWPAMWSSSFWQEGPGLLSAELADELGVIMGTSHHEPLCRAGVEWQQQYAKYSESNAWNFSTNEKGITQFWKEGLERSKGLENVITIGMRGESDSKLLSQDATMADNVAVLKNAIRVQHELIRNTINSDLSAVPRMLAIYKEVEDFFFGDESCEGLRHWDELEDVLFLLADDNFGNLRSLPPGPHAGGYGMYYHFDYHGAPVSYEWQNSVRLPKIWEQMSRAWEAGVREMWIVNVGDIKGVEYPLNYFMDLAYDIDRWGAGNLDSSAAYAKRWMDVQFGERLSAVQKQEILTVLEGFSKWNALRRPEAMSPKIYHPFHYNEAERVWIEISDLLARADVLKETLPEDCQAAYRSMVYYPAAASMNNIMINLEAGWNAALAMRGCVSANRYRDAIRSRIQKDSDLIAAFHAFKGGKWNHMMDSAHSCFRSWDDHDWTWPSIHEVVPFQKGKICAAFRGDSRYSLGEHWQDNTPLSNDAFTRPGLGEVVFDIDSRGALPFDYTLEMDSPWLSCSNTKGRHDPGQEKPTSLVFSCKRSLLTGPCSAGVSISCRFEDGQSTRIQLSFNAAPDLPGLRHACHVEAMGYICMQADSFFDKQDLNGRGWRLVKALGRNGPALLSYPLGQSWSRDEPAPFASWAFHARETGRYKLIFCLAPRNPGVRGQVESLVYSLNEGEKISLETLPKTFYTEWQDEDWNSAVMNNRRLVHTQIDVKEGENILNFYASSPGIILETIVLHPERRPLPESYLGPPASWLSS